MSDPIGGTHNFQYIPGDQGLASVPASSISTEPLHGTFARSRSFKLRQARGLFRQARSEEWSVLLVRDRRSDNAWRKQTELPYLTPKSSTSNNSVAPGGIAPPAPREP